VTGQLPFALPDRASTSRDDLVTGAHNAEALGWIDSWPNWSSYGLVLWGAPGSGKSHHATVWARLSGGITISGASLRVADALAATRHVAVDDADRCGDEAALFHLLNAVREAGCSVVLTGSTPPSRWPVALPDLRSRLHALPLAELQAPDDQAVAALLVKLFADRQLRPSPDVVAFLGARLERSVETLRHAVARLDAAALAERRDITIPFARAVLRGEGVID
jgi:chromosomal replication initiation ATPase DnaA